MRYLALDLGTSFLKGAVLDLERAEIDHVSRTPFPASLPGLPPRHVEVDPKEIVASTERLLEQLSAQAPDAAGVVVTSQMHGIVLMDKEGNALSNAVTWQDQRILDLIEGAPETYFDRLSAKLSPEVIAATGNGFKPSLPLCTLVWWASKGKRLEGTVPASLPDYVLATIGGMPPVVEPTMAASMGMLDLNTNHWHHDLIQALELDQLVWPRTVDNSAPSYELMIGGRRLPCYAPVGDHQCALVGALLQPDELSVNISTGSQLGVIVPHFVPGAYETRPYFDAGFLQAITRIPAGRGLNALVGLLTELAQAEGYSVRDPWATIAAAVEATPQTDLHIDITFFATSVGERGAMQNLSEENLRVGHLFRGAFQAMARYYQICSQELAPPQPWTRLVFSGGLAQNFAALRDEVASALKLPYRICPTSEDTLLGLLALARVAAGAAPNVAASVKQLSSEILPTVSPAK
jgi:sedoheptulokinase